MDRTTQRLEAWRSATGPRDEQLLDLVRARLDDDLDTPGATALIDSVAANGASVTDAASLLGIVL
jgi:hypothetical protein